MSGPAGDTGYDYQADAFAYVSAYLMTRQRLSWFDEIDDTPLALEMETDGPGDDLKIDSPQSLTIEVQAKHGLKRDQRFRDAVLHLFRGLQVSPDLFTVLLVDSSASGPIRIQLREDVIRISQSRTDKLRKEARELLELLDNNDISDRSLFKRFRIIVRDLDEACSDRASAITRLERVVSDPEQARTVWEVLGKEGHKLTKHRGRRDAASLARLVGQHVKLCGQPNALISAHSFFEDFLRPERVFNHCWSLVGRSQHLEELTKFVTEPYSRVATVAGRGGIGKTKLLHAFANSNLGDWSVWFVQTASTFAAEDLRFLPERKCVVVVDDAHRYDELNVLLSQIRVQRPKVKVLLVTRPHALDFINSTIINSGFDVSQLDDIAELRELSSEEVKELARQVVPADWRLAERLARVTADCPLVTVIGGRLLADKSVAPELLERDEDFRRAVLSKFEEILLGQIDPSIDSDLCKRLLEVIAAATPFQHEAVQVLESVAAFVKREHHEIVAAIGALEAAGVLIRRGYAFRIVPDVLSDHILYKASVTPQGRSTGFAKHIFDAMGAICGTEILRNLAELDWRLRTASEDSADLLSEIWSNIESEFRGSKSYARARILSSLKEAAYYIPRKVLSLIDYAFSEAATRPAGASLETAIGREPSAEMPDLLKRIGYTRECLPKCLELLWQLKLSSSMHSENKENKALSTLKDIAQYDLYKPLYVNRTVVDAIARWLSTQQGRENTESVLTLMDALMQKTGTTNYAEDHQIVMRPFLVSYDSTKTFRSRVVDLLASCLQQDGPRIVVRTIKSFETAVRNPFPPLNLKIDEQQRNAWIPEQQRLIKILREFVGTTSDALIHFHVVQAMSWHAVYESRSALRDVARDVILAIPDSFELRLQRTIVRSGHRFWPSDHFDGDAGSRVDITKEHEAHNRLLQQVADEFVTKFPEPAQGYQGILAWLQRLSDCDVESFPGSLLYTIAVRSSDYGFELSEHVIANPDSVIAGDLRSLVEPLRRVDKGRASALFSRAVATGEAGLCTSVAMAFTYSDWLESPTDTDVEILDRLLVHDDSTVQACAFDALRTFGRSHPEHAVARAIAAEPGTDANCAAALAGLIDKDWGVQFEAVDSSQCEQLLEKFVSTERLDDHRFGELLSRLLPDMPFQVLSFLFKRIDHAEQIEGYRYEAFPFDDFHGALATFRECKDYDDVIRRIRDRALLPPAENAYWLPKLFAAVSNFDDRSLKALAEWIDSGEESKVIAAADLLSEAPYRFVLNEVDFVVNTLDRASQVSANCCDRVQAKLFSTAAYGERMGTAGEPFPRDVQLRDESRKIRTRLPPDSPARDLYQRLEQHASSEIRDQRLRDEQQLE